MFDFDNRLGVFFPDVHHDTQFSILIFAGSAAPRHRADFFFERWTLRNWKTRNATSL